MAIRNLNTIQNPNDLDYVKQVSDEYLVQSLANLGQRVGLQGDSIITDSFKFSDLINGGETLDPSNYIGYVKLDKDLSNVSFGVRLKSNYELEGPIAPAILYGANSSYDKNDYIITNVECQLTKLINNIDSYDVNGIISISPNFYTFAFKGLQYNDDEKIITPAEYICESINKMTNMLYSGIRIRTINYGTNKYTVLIHIFKDPNYQNKYNIHIYNHINTYIDIASAVNEMENIVQSEIKPEILTPDVIMSNQKVIQNYKLNDSPKYVMTAEWDENSHTFVNFEFLNYISDIDKGFINEANLQSVVTLFSYDVIYLYRYIKEYYSEIVFNSDSTQLKKQIIANLLKFINVGELTIDTLYIPLDYVFNYAVNSNNQWEIYYNTLDLIVKYIISTQAHSLISQADNTSIYAITTKSERVSLYNYDIEYDPENDNTVYGVNIYKKYTLPYINNENYWVLNEVDSNVYAKGMNAGNPNIIILRSRGNQDDPTPDIITAASYSKPLEKVQWKKQQAIIKRTGRFKKNEDVTAGIQFMVVNYSLPDLSKSSANELDELLIELDNALIINMATIDSVVYSKDEFSDYPLYEEIINENEDLFVLDRDGEDDETLNKNSELHNEITNQYGDGVITTLWNLVNDGEHEAYFDYLKDSITVTTDLPNNIEYALDFNYITDLTNIVQYAIDNHEQTEPDNYEHRFVVFDGANVKIKNETEDTNMNVYPIITNKRSNEYGGIYSNDLNFNIKYNDTLIGDLDKHIISYTEQSTRRYFLNELTSTYVTNDIYSYMVDGIRMTYNEYAHNYNVPTFDLADVITRNETLLNRLNILSLDKDGSQYNAYLGVVHDRNKNELILGTDTQNINMSTYTMVDINDRPEFKKQDKLHIEFDDLHISSRTQIDNGLTVDNNIVNNHIIWDRKVNSKGVSYWSTVVNLKGRYIFEPNEKLDTLEGFTYIQYTIDEPPSEAYIGYISPNAGLTYMYPEHEVSKETYIGELVTYENIKYLYENQKLFTSVFVPEQYIDSFYDEQNNIVTDYISEHVYIADGIYIPTLLTYLGFEDRIISNEYVMASNFKPEDYQEHEVDEDVERDYADWERKEITYNIYNLTNIEITSNMHKLSYNFQYIDINGEDIHNMNANVDVAFVSTTTNMGEENLYIRDVDTNGVYSEHFEDFTYGVFSSNVLKITYYVSESNTGDVIHLNVQEQNNDVMPYIYKLRTNYFVNVNAENSSEE